MRRILALLLALSMLFALTACGDNTTDNGGSTTTDPNRSTASTDTHTHSYTDEVTAEATCTAEGTRTFACSCGDTYTEAIPAQHSWGEWQAESFAMVGKPGTEKRTCSVCSASEDQERTANAIANSFFDIGFTYFAINDECKLTGPGLVAYALNAFPEFRDTPVKSKTLFGKLMNYFPVPEQLMSDAKYAGAMTGWYNESEDTFKRGYDEEQLKMGNLTILGYVHQGDNTYAVYFQCNNGMEDRYCEFVVEYNRLNGDPNYYVSSRVVSELPTDMVKCSDGEQYELTN